MRLKRGFNIVKNIIFLFAVLIIFTVIMMLFREYSAQIPLKLIFTVLLIQVIFYFVSVFFMRISVLKYSQDIVECGDKIKLGLYINKRSIYPFKEAEFLLSYKSNYEEKYNNIRVRMELGDTIKQRQEVEIPANNCGYVTVQLKYAIIYDMFSLVSIKRKMKKSDTVIMVMPKAKPVLITNENMCHLSLDVEEVFNSSDDENSRDRYEIREFIPGDSLNRIHWKLTAKADEFMVRDLVDVKETNLYVYFDLRKGININEMYENSISFAKGLVERNSIFYMVWVEFDNKTFKYALKRKKVNNMSVLLEGVAYIMRLPLCENEAEMNNLLGQIRNDDGSVNSMFML